MSQPCNTRIRNNNNTGDSEINHPPLPYPTMPHPGMPDAVATAMGHLHSGGLHPRMHPYHPSPPPSAASKNKRKGSKGSSKKKKDGADNADDNNDGYPETMAQAKQRLLLKQIQDLKREKAVLVQENSTLKQQQEQCDKETNDEADPQVFWAKEQELEGVREERCKLAERLEEARDEIVALKEKLENRECEFDILLQESLEDAEKISQLQSKNEALQQQLGEAEEDEDNETDKKPKAEVAIKTPPPARKSSTKALAPPNRRATRATTVATVLTADPTPSSKKRAALAKPTDSLPAPKRTKPAPTASAKTLRLTQSSASVLKTSKKDKPTRTTSVTGTTKIASSTTLSKREMAHREKQALQTLRDFIVDECGGTKAMMEGFGAHGMIKGGSSLVFYYRYEDERHGPRRFRSKLEVMRFLGLDEEKDTATTSRNKKKGSSSTELGKTRSYQSNSLAQSQHFGVAI